MKDKVVVIIGGASGMGRAMAERFVSEGARVVVGDVQEAKLAEVAQWLGDAGVVSKTDVTVESDVERLVALAAQRFGRLDVGINCAGGSAPAPLLETSAEKWQRDVALNLTGSFYALKQLARQMVAFKTPGVLLCVSSVTSRVGAMGLGPYASAKAGLNHLVRIAALEFAPLGIRVAGIAPGLVETPMTEALMSMPAAVDAYLANVPLKRPGRAHEVASAALFLASDEGSYLTGEVLAVDGGQHAMGWTSMV
jgi:NAD(P)-dependent dehydrogenase (short-subunit alcohol dehydrogenase family)